MRIRANTNNNKTLGCLRILIITKFNKFIIELVEDSMGILGNRAENININL